MSPLRRAVLAALAGYKRWVSPLLPGACRFTPTCSEYAAEAVRVHGVPRGLRLAVGRLLRCRPFARAGWDPVPPPRPPREPAARAARRRGQRFG